MPSKLRLQRISDRIREELSEIVLFEVSDPRLNNITVTDVKVDREYAYANIYISAIEGHERSTEILAALEHAKGYLRSTLAKRIQLRVFPRLRFHWDPTPERANYIEKLLDSLKSETDVSTTIENEE
ncbi:MAG: 30S ribosome-binding factor RbfA [Anaerolineaceae bacterium]|jgi:ribosome-binding factor A|nr:30S ribosome-binding factor RbfA [Anaerolineaceae bacterium]